MESGPAPADAAGKRGGVAEEGKRAGYATPPAEGARRSSELPQRIGSGLKYAGGHGSGSSGSAGRGGGHKMSRRIGWVDADNVWEKFQLAPVSPDDDKASCGSFSYTLTNDVRAAAEVIRRDKWTFVVPLLLFAVLAGLGLWGVSAAATSSHDAARSASAENLALRKAAAAELAVLQAVEQAAEQAAALGVATNVAQDLENSLFQVMSPALTVAVFVHKQPQYPYMEDNFAELAIDILAEDGYAGEVRTTWRKYISSMQLATNGVVSSFYPLAGNEGAIGHDLLSPNQTAYPSGWPEALKLVPGKASWPSRRVDALRAIGDRKLTLAGPITLTQNNRSALVIRYPIFIRNVSATEQFGRPWPLSSCNLCYDVATGTKFWGFSIVLVDYASVLDVLAGLTGQGYAYQVVATNTATSVNTTIATNGLPLAPAPVEQQIPLPNNLWFLRLAPAAGWLQPLTNETLLDEDLRVEEPGWKVPLMALAVVVAFVIAVSLFYIVVNKRRHQYLLRSMLPKKVIPVVERGQNFVESFANVTVLFSDIVSYTNLASELSPMQVVNMLNELYSEYDKLVEQHGLYKVETIGDAFLCAGGVPNSGEHVDNAVRVARMAQSMIDVTSRLVTKEGLKLQIRIGIHSGPVVAAVIGLKMPRYCLFGDTVNVASRMETNSQPMRIHISDSTRQLLLASGEPFNIELRGVLELKGRGRATCFWLNGNDGGSGGGGGGGANGTQSSAVIYPIPDSSATGLHLERVTPQPRLVQDSGRLDQLRFDSQHELLLHAPTSSSLVLPTVYVAAGPPPAAASLHSGELSLGMGLGAPSRSGSATQDGVEPSNGSGSSRSAAAAVSGRDADGGAGSSGRAAAGAVHSRGQHVRDEDNGMTRARTRTGGNNGDDDHGPGSPYFTPTADLIRVALDRSDSTALSDSGQVDAPRRSNSAA